MVNLASSFRKPKSPFKPTMGCSKMQCLSKNFDAISQKFCVKTFKKIHTTFLTLPLLFEKIQKKKYNKILLSMIKKTLKAVENHIIKKNIYESKLQPPLKQYIQKKISVYCYYFPTTTTLKPIRIHYKRVISIWNTLYQKLQRHINTTPYIWYPQLLYIIII